MLRSAGGLAGRASRLQAARIVPETTKCLWRASLPTWTITGHLLLRPRRYGFYVLDRIDRERDGSIAAEPLPIEAVTI
jgi:hypothetical protein